METPLSAASQIAIATLKERAPEAFELAGSFKAAGFRLALVGGTVRDALLNRLGNDLDFTTDAKPEESKKILKKSLRMIFGMLELSLELSAQSATKPHLK